jgi:hypothetical protein
MPVAADGEITGASPEAAGGPGGGERPGAGSRARDLACLLRGGVDLRPRRRERLSECAERGQG